MKSLLPIVVWAFLKAMNLSAENSVVADGATPRKLAGDFAFAEGAACDRQGNVYFTDQPNDRILKWSVEGKLSTFLQPSGRSNGLCLDSAGNIWACADEYNQIWKISPAGKVEKIVTEFAGKLLNGPNDLWVRPDGGVYFTDPFYPRDYWRRGPIEQTGECVYFLAPDHKKVTKVIADFTKPNGLVGTPDGKTLYVSDIGGKKTWRYDVLPDGNLTNKTLFCELGSDGMTMDQLGNVYLTGEGVSAYDPQGKKIAQIDNPEPGWTGNVCFGGADGKTLFITATKNLFAVSMKVAGAGSQ